MLPALSDIQLDTILEGLSQAILIVDQAGDVVYITALAEAIFGKHPTGFDAASSSAAHSPLHGPIARALGGEIVDGAEFFLRNETRPEGLWLLASARPLYSSSGARRGAIATFRDTAELRRARANSDLLHETEQRFRAFIENSAEGFVLLAADGSVLHTGPPILGYERNECVGLSVLELIHPDDSEMAAGLLQQVLENPGGTVRVRHRVLHKNGSWRWIEGSCRNLLHEPLIGGIIVNYRDDTARTQLEEQFRQAQKMEALGALAGGVAHDFNNLLTIVTGYTQIMLEDGRFPQRHRGPLEQVVHAAQQAACLTSQLLAFSSPHATRPRLVDLNQVVTDIQKMLRRVIGEHVELVTELRQSGQIKVDPGHLEQVIMNLAVNARDAMPEGGQLRIETRPVELTAASETVAPPGAYVLLSVGDTGHGMDEETKSRLFEPFFTTKPKGKGTGLGLSTVYSIVRQNGGSIQVWSEPGAGTRFQIYLPRAEEAAEPSPRQPICNGGPGATVLLVEDDEPVRKLVRYMLERNGYRVLEAGDGPSAVQVAEHYEGPLDLLLTDVVMPSMSGCEVAQRLGSMRPGLKVLFMSGYTNDGVACYGLQDGIGGEILKKPFNSQELIHSLQQVLTKGEVPL